MAGKHFNILRTAQIFPLVTYIFFGHTKKDIRGRRFHSDEEVQEWVRFLNAAATSSFYKTGIDRLVTQCE